jgi:DNA-binding NtrC family response regulator
MRLAEIGPAKLRMIRVLFVDDEPKILQGLMRSLRPMRKQWEVEFATGGHAALEMLAASRFDVLVTDMRMPGMDGFALLNAVVQLHPHLLRIALSGESEMEGKVRSTGMAHDYLAKPCVVDQLTGAIQRLLSNSPVAAL